jgi:hypothetical protein
VMHLTDADGNVALGYAALGVDTLGSTSTAIGTRVISYTKTSLQLQIVITYAVGYHSGLNVTTGTNNTLIGAAAGDAIN